LDVLAVAIQDEQEALTVAVALALGAALVLVAVFALVAAGFFSFSSFLGSAFLAAAGFASFFASFTVPEAPLGRRKSPFSSPEVMARLTWFLN
jgi:hypothetical protein